MDKKRKYELAGFASYKKKVSEFIDKCFKSIRLGERLEPKQKEKLPEWIEITNNFKGTDFIVNKQIEFILSALEFLESEDYCDWEDHLLELENFKHGRYV